MKKWLTERLVAAVIPGLVGSFVVFLVDVGLLDRQLGDTLERILSVLLSNLLALVPV